MYKNEYCSAIDVQVKQYNIIVLLLAVIDDDNNSKGQQ